MAESFVEEEGEECHCCATNVVNRVDDVLEFGIGVVEFLGNWLLAPMRPLMAPCSYPRSRKP